MLDRMCKLHRKNHFNDSHDHNFDRGSAWVVDHIILCTRG